MINIKQSEDWDLVKYSFGYEFINRWDDRREGIFKTKKSAMKFFNSEGLK